MTDKNMPSKMETANHLENGNVAPLGLIPIGSNYTFLVDVEYQGKTLKAIYKPEVGEQPLWDFPPGTLYQREYASYVLSELLQWYFVPTTVIREGPYGIGSLQQFIDADPETNYFTIRENQPEELKKIAVFDLITNNADRKASHCFTDNRKHIWSIDHGLTFHEHWKLRTVIWDFIDQNIPITILNQLRILKHSFTIKSPEIVVLQSVLKQTESEALENRLDSLLQNQKFPQPDNDRRNIPWPWF
ncbi:MAG: SCO1664 family protein [SAR202 cluster bacterium]|nr:SCO1664 family protein [SAR202 cluster bacterium]|tara:strand:+ start:4841 stop:5575 length:735 start_codon:yes stop_codon:yes gene_type:complete